jgi:hypothetical protein
MRVLRVLVLAAVVPLCASAISVFPEPGGGPNDFITGNDSYTGVAILTMGYVHCSGSLLWTGQHILTAAHCLDEGVIPSATTATFRYSGGTMVVNGAQITIPAQWTGDPNDGWDWAILTLVSPVTNPLIDRYEINTDPADDWGEITIVGFGIGGTGETGQDPVNYPFGTRRVGENEAEGYWVGVGPGGDATLVYDFDGNGVNTFGSVGLGAGHEVVITSGDSGGPSFRDGKIVGVHSTISVFGYPWAQYGDIGTDTRVSSYAQELLDSVPEPSALILFSLGLILLLLKTENPKTRDSTLNSGFSERSGLREALCKVNVPHSASRHSLDSSPRYAARQRSAGHVPL